MMKLDNQYTSIEQSEKLIELGVPEDSADCYYEMSYRPIRQLLPDDVLFSQLPQYMDDEDGDLDIVPCWSAGRLIEIQEKCTGARLFRTLHPDLLGDIMGQIEYTIETVGMDFSRLESEK